VWQRARYLTDWLHRTDGRYWQVTVKTDLTLDQMYSGYNYTVLTYAFGSHGNVAVAARAKEGGERVVTVVLTLAILDGTLIHI
jgi:hypothetical protein